MKNKKISFSIFTVSMFVLAFALIFPTVSSIYAQSSGLGITPRKDYTIEPGKGVNDRLYLDNLSEDENLRVSINVVDFSAADESGTPELNRDDNAEPTPWSLKPFINVTDSVEVKPGDPVFVPFEINIPAEQGAGSYYSAIEYVAETEGGEQVNIAASSATLVFVTVPGDAKELLTLEQFGAYKAPRDGEEGNFSSFFFSSPPEEMAYRLTNEGNVAERPSGSIVIKNIFGDQSHVIEEANPKDSLALLGQTRRFQVCVDTEKQTETSQSGTESESEVCQPASLKPGRYTAELTLLYGQNGSATQEIAAKATFWYLPFWFIAIVVAVLLAIVGAGYSIYRRRSKSRLSRSSR